MPIRPGSMAARPWPLPVRQKLRRTRSRGFGASHERRVGRAANRGGPRGIRRRVGGALGGGNVVIRRLEGGTPRRTFSVQAAARRAVLRIEKRPARQLPRALAAQSLAATAGVAVPEVLASAGSGSEAEPFWFLEAFVEGEPF